MPKNLVALCIIDPSKEKTTLETRKQETTLKFFIRVNMCILQFHYILLTFKCFCILLFFCFQRSKTFAVLSKKAATKFFVLVAACFHFLRFYSFLNL